MYTAKPTKPNCFRTSRYSESVTIPAKRTLAGPNPTSGERPKSARASSHKSSILSRSESTCPGCFNSSYREIACGFVCTTWKATKATIGRNASTRQNCLTRLRFEKEGPEKLRTRTKTSPVAAISTEEREAVMAIVTTADSKNIPFQIRFPCLASRFSVKQTTAQDSNNPSTFGFPIVEYTRLVRYRASS